jgi:hypothetical protein
LSALAKNTTATRYLSNTGTTNNPAWAQIDLTNGVTGILPVANGGTNASSASITAFNNITGYSATGATGTTSTKLVFSTSPTITTPTISGSFTAQTGTALNIGPTNYDIALDDYVGGTLKITAVQGGVGTSYWFIPFVKRGTLVLGTAQKAILTADPIGSVTVSSGSARVSVTYGNTYLSWSVEYLPTAA